MKKYILMVLLSFFGMCMAAEESVVQRAERVLQQLDSELSAHWAVYGMSSNTPDMKLLGAPRLQKIGVNGETVKDPTPLKWCGVYGKSADLWLSPQAVVSLAEHGASAANADAVKVLVRGLGDARTRANYSSIRSYYRADYGALRTLVYGHRNVANPAALMGFMAEHAYAQRFYGEKGGVRSYLQQYAVKPDYQEMLAEALQHYPVDDAKKLLACLQYEDAYITLVMLRDLRASVSAAQQQAVEKMIKQAEDNLQKTAPTVTPDFQRYMQKKYPAGVAAQQAKMQVVLNFLNEFDVKLKAHWRNYKLHRAKMSIKIERPAKWSVVNYYGKQVKDATPLSYCAIYGKDEQLYVFPEYVDALRDSNNAGKKMEPVKVLVRAVGDARARNRYKFFGTYYRADYGGVRTLTYGHANRANTAVLIGFITEYEYMKTQYGEKRSLKDYLRQYATQEGYREMITECLQNYPVDNPELLPQAIDYEHMWLSYVMHHDMVDAVTPDMKKAVELQIQALTEAVAEAEKKLSPAFVDYIKKKYPVGSLKQAKEQMEKAANQHMSANKLLEEKKKRVLEQKEQILQNYNAMIKNYSEGQQYLESNEVPQLTMADMKLFRMKLRRELGMEPSAAEVQQEIQRAIYIKLLSDKLSTIPGAWTANGPRTPEIIQMKRECYVYMRDALAAEVMESMQLFMMVNSKITTPAMSTKYLETLKTLQVNMVLAWERYVDFLYFYDCKNESIKEETSKISSALLLFAAGLSKTADGFLRKFFYEERNPYPEYEQMLNVISHLRFMSLGFTFEYGASVFIPGNIYIVE